MALIIDDLHWADEPSLLLLRYAAAELASSGLLVVGTYRDVELGRHHPLAGLLAEMGGNKISLHGLDTDDIARYIEMSAGTKAPTGLAEVVHAQTDGNPFFVGEVVRLLASEGRLTEADRASWEPEIPQGVREVVGRRLDRLSKPANEALKTAAAIGREFDGELLLKVAELTPKELLTAATEAIAERLVTDLGDGRYSFSHALVRDTLYEELSAAQRARLHERIAYAVEEICGHNPDERLGELAHHFLAAAPRGDLAKAIDYAERAAVQDMEQLAYEDATDLLERALEVFDLVDEPDEAHRCKLLLALGGAEVSASQVADARRAFGRAANSARKIGDADSLVGAAIGISMLTTAGKVDQRLVDLIDETLEMIGPETSARRAALLSAKSQELYWRDAQGQAGPLVDEAIEIAREVKDPDTLAAALVRKLFMPVGPNASHERLAIADEMLELGESCGNREVVLRAHAYRLWSFLELGDLSGVDRELAIYASLAEELRMPQHIWHTHALRGMRALLDGEIEEAERIAEVSRRAGERAEQPLATQYYGIQLTQIRSLQGRAGELLPSVRELADRFPGIPAWRTALIGLAARSGDLELGRVELERFAGDDFSAIPMDANWFTGMSLLGESIALLGDEKRAALAYDELLPYEGLVIVVARAAGCNGPVDRVLGMLAHTVGRLDDAERHLQAGLEIATRMGDRIGMILCKLHLAEVALSRDDAGSRERALELLTEVLGRAREIRARFIVEHALRLRLDAQGLSGVDVTTSIDELVSELESERPDVRAHAAPDGTVAILFSDIEDSTIITERLGDERWLEVLREHNDVFREQIDSHDGYEVKSQGDGFMLAFPEPCRALEYAIAVQRAFASRTEEPSEESSEELRVRMGLHTGEVIAEEGDFFGKNVILAARIAAQATGGEILVSDQMREAAEGHDAEGIELRFDEGRELELKGLAGTHRVYRADWEVSVVP
jgi:class 3 adenylate cyclase